MKNPSKTYEKELEECKAQYREWERTELSTLREAAGLPPLESYQKHKAPQKQPELSSLQRAAGLEFLGKKG